jgi:hypothetical protein
MAVVECSPWGEFRAGRENEDALTFELGNGPGRRFVKWAPAGSPLDLAAEMARMTWAVAYTPSRACSAWVPIARVLGWSRRLCPAAARSRRVGWPTRLQDYLTGAEAGP